MLLGTLITKYRFYSFYPEPFISTNAEMKFWSYKDLTCIIAVQLYYKNCLASLMKISSNKMIHNKTIGPNIKIFGKNNFFKFPLLCYILNFLTHHLDLIVCKVKERKFKKKPDIFSPYSFYIFWYNFFSEHTLNAKIMHLFYA